MNYKEIEDLYINVNNGLIRPLRYWWVLFHTSSQSEEFKAFYDTFEVFFEESLVLFKN